MSSEARRSRESPGARGAGGGRSATVRIAGGLLVLVVWLSLAAGGARGTGGLTVGPTRVVFEGRGRAASLTLVNRGSESATYRISFIELRMTETGRLERIAVPRPGERSAADLVRYSPRRVELEPGGVQTVRLMLRKPAELEPGEYRSHLLFRAVPPAAEAGTSLVPATPDRRRFDIRLIPVYGVSIPVIVRHGDLSTGAALSELAMTAGDGQGAPPRISLRLDRRGERSLYGDLRMSFIPDRGGDEVAVGEISGLAVYPPNPSRRLEIPLDPPAGLALRHGVLRVEYATGPDAGSRVLAAGRLKLP